MIKLSSEKFLLLFCANEFLIAPPYTYLEREPISCLSNHICIVGKIVNSLYIGLAARWPKEEMGLPRRPPC